MLLIATVKNDTEMGILFENIRYARKQYGCFYKYFNDFPVEDPDKLAIVVEQETETGKREIVMEKTALNMDAVNFLLSNELVCRLLQEGRLRIHTPYTLR